MKQYRVHVKNEDFDYTSTPFKTMSEAKKFARGCLDAVCDIEEYEYTPRRNWDAWMITQGACNPSGIARTLVKAIDEARTENGDTDYVREDVACRMICHQLAHLFNLAEYDMEVVAYSRDYQFLENAAKEQYDVKLVEEVDEIR